MKMKMLLVKNDFDDNSVVIDVFKSLVKAVKINEYKDYILGFIFYKFLSDNEVRHLKEKACWTDEEIKNDLKENILRIS